MTASAGLLAEALPIHTVRRPSRGDLRLVPTPPSESALVDALRGGDEEAFASLVRKHHAAMVRVALAYVPSVAVAEEVVQETWIDVLQGIDRFEGRSSLRTWMFRILTNVAKTRGEKESRTLPFSTFVDREASASDPAVSPERFLPAGHAEWPHHWDAEPGSWEGIPEGRLLGAETRRVVAETIDGLPPAQRTVITLRDVEDCTSAEVCEVLGISEGNQRVLLHRARSKVRAALERYLEESA